MEMPLFTVDKTNSDLDVQIGEDGEFFVDVAGLCSVCIHVGKEAVSVDIYKLEVTDGPAASCYAETSDLLNK